jgi:general secretion pathway protein H
MRGRLSGRQSLCRSVTLLSHRGFTLIELLVALVILAIGLSGAVVAFRPDYDRQIGDEAERLALLLEQAEEESTLGGMPIAWVASENGYAFERREVSMDGPSWNILREDDLLHPHALPGMARIEWVRADGRLVEPGERAILGSQGVQQIAVSLALGEARARVERRPDGRYASGAWRDAG